MDQKIENLIKNFMETVTHMQSQLNTAFELIRSQDAECKQFHERLCEMEKRLNIK